MGCAVHPPGPGNGGGKAEVPGARPRAVDLAWRDVGLGVMLVAVAILLASLRWWPRRRDRGTLLGVLFGLNLLVGGGIATLLTAWVEARTGALQALAAWAWYAFLTWAATRSALPPDVPPAAPTGTLLFRCTLAGLACGPLVLLGLLAGFALMEELGALLFVLAFGAFVALVLGGAVGFLLGLVDVLAVRRLTRAAR